VDQKGGNILVNTEGIVKLADFGAAKSFQDAVENQAHTIVGTPYWMAPEVLSGVGYSAKADIWSLGCTVVEMFTASHPWKHLSDHYGALLALSQTNDLPEIPTNISKDAKDFIEQCLNRDPRMRPDSGQLLVHRWIVPI
jgi:serine/threonine protein kinase